MAHVIAMGQRWMVRRAGVGVVAVTLALLVGCGADQQADPATLRDFAQTYVRLLTTRDEPALRKHLNNPSQPDDARQRIEARGGTPWQIAEVTWAEQTEGSYRLTVEVKDAAGAQSTWVDNVEFEDDGSWRMGPLAGEPHGEFKVAHRSLTRAYVV